MFAFNAEHVMVCRSSFRDREADPKQNEVFVISEQELLSRSSIGAA